MRLATERRRGAAWAWGLAAALAASSQVKAATVSPPQSVLARQAPLLATRPVRDLRRPAVSPLAGVRVTGSTIRVTRASFAHFTGPGLSEVLQSAMATPRLEAGRITGFQLSHLKAGSLWSVLGFRDGDVITAVNEMRLTDPLAAIAQLQALRDARKVGISVRRGGA